jgi:hypothetical protein
MTGLVAALDGGTFYHDEALRGARYRRHFDRTIYLPALGAADLSDIGALIVTCRSNARQLVRFRDRLAAFLRTGGMLAVMGETRPDLWLAGVQWAPRPTNWWWWLERGATLGLTTPAPDHSLWAHLMLANCEWHYHGVLSPPPRAQPLVQLPDGGTLLYDDRDSFAPGRAVVTTLDPFYHHGSHFMPATTRFLDGFLPWLCAEAGAVVRTA